MHLQLVTWLFLLARVAVAAAPWSLYEPLVLRITLNETEALEIVSNVEPFDISSVKLEKMAFLRDNDGHYNTVTSHISHCKADAHLLSHMYSASATQASGMDRAEELKESDEPGKGKNPKKDEKLSTHAEKSDEPDEDEEETLPDDAPCPDITKERFWCSDCGGKDEDGKCKGVSGWLTFVKLLIRRDQTNKRTVAY